MNHNKKNNRNMLSSASQVICVENGEVIFNIIISFNNKLLPPLCHIFKFL